MGIEDADGVGSVIRVLYSGVVGGRVKIESSWSTVAEVVRVVGVVGIGGEVAGFEAESLARVVRVARVVGVVGIGGEVARFAGGWSRVAGVVGVVGVVGVAGIGVLFSE